MSENNTSHVGPIVFSDETARGQLVEHGEVTTFRASDRTTGSTWWRESRTGEKMGDCHVECVAEDVNPMDDDVLLQYQPYSGFESVVAWRNAIRDLHGDVPSRGNIYHVTTPKNEPESKTDTVPTDELDEIVYSNSHSEGDRGLISAQASDAETAREYHHVKLLNPTGSVGVALKWTCDHCGRVSADPKRFEQFSCIKWENR